MDTAGWQTFDQYGIAFDYPAEWEILRNVCSDCEVDDPPLEENEFTAWDIADAEGNRLATVHPNSATDTDGDFGRYDRTDLERVPVTGIDHEAVSVVFEHTAIDLSRAPEGRRDAKQTASMFVSSDRQLAKRDEHPFLPFFQPRAEVSTMLLTTDGFLEIGGLDPEHLGVGQAREFMDSQRYRTMREVMLSVRAGGSGI